MVEALPKIAVFAGPTATILNTPPLLSDARVRADVTEGGRPGTFRGLRAQRLAAPATVYVEQFSAHPLEADAASLYGPPDGWLDPTGALHDRPASGATPVYRVELRPEDGLYLLPYVARQGDGSPWDDATASPGAPRDESRQTFFPDAARLYEEIDRFALDFDGRSAPLVRRASFEFFRAAPPGGWTRGHPGTATPAEVEGEDFFAYFPTHLRSEPTAATLAAVTNLVQRVLRAGDYVGAQWLEGSPAIEETLYWLGLLIDTQVPIVGHSAQRPHGSLSADGDRNIVDGVDFIVSRVWAGEDGANLLGAVLIVDEMVYSAREVTKTDARPGNHEVVGGHGGVVASFGGSGPPHLTFIPTRRHTYRSEVKLTALPREVHGVRFDGNGPHSVRVAVTEANGELIADAVPHVTFHKFGRYTKRSADPGPEEPALEAIIADNLRRSPLAGFVGEGLSPYATMLPTTDRHLERAVLSGMPVVKVGRGNPGGDAHRSSPLFVSGNDLSANKARLLLMAAMLRLGAIPPATVPAQPSGAEMAAAQAAVAAYQRIFDTH